MQGWGLGFFRINAEGHVTVHPDGNPTRGLDLYQLAMDLKAQGVGLPLLLRFSDILQARIEPLADRVPAARSRSSGTRAATPRSIRSRSTSSATSSRRSSSSATPHGVGLECGSKPELQAVLGLTESTDHLIVCNGYKDEEFMRLALMGQKLGHTVFIVLEQLSELDVLLEVADEMGVTPTARRAHQAGHRGLGPLGQERRREVEVRPQRRELMKLLDRLERARAGRTSSSWSTSTSAARSPTSATSRRGSRRSARFYVELRAMGVRPHPRGRGRRARRGLRRLPLHPARERELLAAGVRQRRRVHPRQRSAASTSCRCRTSSASRGARSRRTTRCC